jgi:DNA-binding transcriptional regulator LsrR (DeoR family)
MARQRIMKRSTKAQVKRMDRASIVQSMVDSGMSQSEVARILNISRQAVNQLLNRHKLNARQYLRIAIKRGDVVRPQNCDDCGVKCNPEGHHNDYGLPLEVQWLCSLCHVIVDNKGHNTKYTSVDISKRIAELAP